jgi:hypothetical protein
MVFIFHITSSHTLTNTHLCLILHQDILLDPKSEKQIQEAWVGDWFSLFYAVVIGYFVADLIWVILVPKCVKSPVSQFVLVHFSNTPIHRLDSNHLLGYFTIKGCHYSASCSYSTLFAFPLHLSKRCLADGGMSYRGD